MSSPYSIPWPRSSEKSAQIILNDDHSKDRGTTICDRIPSSMLTDLSSEELLKVCLTEAGSDAWKELVRRIHPVIAASVSRIARQHGLNTAPFLEDLSQEVYVRLCENRCRALRGFDSRAPGALFSFLKVVASNIARDRCKSAWSLKSGGGKLAVLGREEIEAAPHRNGPDVDRTLLVSEIDAILSRNHGECSGRDRSIFWLYYRQGWSSKDIASLPAFQLTQKGVESLLHRLAKMVKTELAAHQTKVPSEDSL